MSYANPQIQTFSNEGIFQNLQQTISAATGNLANAFINRANEEKKAKEKEAEKLDNWNTSLVSKTQTLGGKISDVSKNSKIPINLSVISQVTKSKYLDLGSELGPGKDKTKSADAMQKMEDIDSYPDRVTNLLSLITTETENYRKGATDGNFASNFKTKGPLVEALGALSYMGASKAELSMDTENVNYTNPAVIIKYKDKDGKPQTQSISNDDVLNWKNSGGFVKFIPNATSTVENIQKKTPNVYESITAQGKNGESVNNLTGRIAKDFLIPGEKIIPGEQDIVIEGKTVKKTVGLVVQDIDIKKISEDPVFDASIDAAANGIFEVDPWEAYSMNEDVFLKQMPKKGMCDLKEPIFEGDTAAQDKADWIRDFKANLKTYQIETLKLKSSQPVLNSDGKTVTRTWEAPDAQKNNNTDNNPGRVPTEGSISRDQFNTNISSAETTPVYFPSSTRLSGRLQYDDTTQTWGYYTNQSAGTGTENWMLDTAFGTGSSKKELAKKIFPGLFTNLP
jgi:hypothetical protein